MFLNLFRGLLASDLPSWTSLPSSPDIRDCIETALLITKSITCLAIPDIVVWRCYCYRSVNLQHTHQIPFVLLGCYQTSVLYYFHLLPHSLELQESQILPLTQDCCWLQSDTLYGKIVRPIRLYTEMSQSTMEQLCSWENETIVFILIRWRCIPSSMLGLHTDKEQRSISAQFSGIVSFHLGAFECPGDSGFGGPCEIHT